MGFSLKITYFPCLVKRMPNEGTEKTFLGCWHPPHHYFFLHLPVIPRWRSRSRAEQRTNTWENTMTFPVSSFTVWMVPWTTALPTTFPVTWPLLLTTATVWLLMEKWMIDWGWGPPSDITWNVNTPVNAWTLGRSHIAFPNLLSK